MDYFGLIIHLVNESTVHQSDMTTMVNGNQSSFNFESDSLDLLTILEICLEFLVTIIGDILYLTIYMSLRKI